MTSPDLRAEERAETVEDALPEEEDRAGLVVPASTFAGSGSVLDVVRLGDAYQECPSGFEMAARFIVGSSRRRALPGLRRVGFRGKAAHSQA
jgi:hypothetical protein